MLSQISSIEVKNNADIHSAQRTALGQSECLNNQCLNWWLGNGNDATWSPKLQRDARLPHDCISNKIVENSAA